MRSEHIRQTSRHAAPVARQVAGLGGGAAVADGVAAGVAFVAQVVQLQVVAPGA